MEYGDVPDPVAGPGQVLIDVHAASVNAADWKVRSGHYAPTTEFPYIPGRDFSGVVSALGAGVTDFKVGDEVFGVSEQSGERCYAEKEHEPDRRLAQRFQQVEVLFPGNTEDVFDLLGLQGLDEEIACFQQGPQGGALR